MIRIDEIYNHTFWTWLERNRPGYRLFFCDPFGSTDPKNLFNYGRNDIPEKDFVFMHDQEPIQIESHQKLFFKAWDDGIADIHPTPRGHIVVSEKGEMLDKLCDIYGWQSHYYFFHGWACLDWYRGYNHTFLFPPPDQRFPTKAFMSPNRIVGGERDHRVLFIYHCQRLGLTQNYISAPRICPYENHDISVIAEKYINTYKDIKQVLDGAQLPWLFKGETIQEMTSCWLGNFAEATDSLIYVPTETVYFGRRTHLTEKTFKAIALGMPFVLVAAAGSLEYLREYGFQTFADLWDESYDSETDDIRRLERVADLLASISSMTPRELQQLQRHCLPVVEHNWNHFYHGGLESVLWQELTAMLGSL